MDNQSTDNTLPVDLEKFYQERISILQDIHLSNLLQADNQLAFLLWENNIAILVRKLLTHYLDTRQKWWETLFLSSQFRFSSLLLRDSHKQARFQYESELANAENRLVRQFGENFCASDYSIDWQKLLRSRSS